MIASNVIDAHPTLRHSNPRIRHVFIHIHTFAHNATDNGSRDASQFAAYPNVQSPQFSTHHVDPDYHGQKLVRTSIWSVAECDQWIRRYIRVHSRIRGCTGFTWTAIKILQIYTEMRICSFRIYIKFYKIVLKTGFYRQWKNHKHFKFSKDSRGNIESQFIMKKPRKSYTAGSFLLGGISSAHPQHPSYHKNQRQMVLS